MVSVVLPTLNEEENIELVVESIDDSLENIEYEIIIVDGGSVDKTPKIARKLSNTYPINLFSPKENLGLSKSIMKGINNSSNDNVVVMDADMQHPPEKINELIDQVDDYDLVLGSRFTSDGEIEDWSYTRKIINRVASSLAFTVLYPLDVNDPMTGFFAFKKDKIDLEVVDSSGFKILLDIIHENELDIKEVGINFSKRERGNSSFGLAEVIDYVEQIGKILFDKLGFGSPKQKFRIFELVFLTSLLVLSTIILLSVL